ncbi:MAG: sensor domain-containing diguanylate cyclase [Acidobacteriota bacterium]|nr:sensor domain-containing diguanylate cyclase [Acidobacteriota bacterium]
MSQELLSLETFRAIVEQSLVGVYVIQDMRFVYANDKFAQLFGYTREAILQLPSVLPLLRADDHNRVAENIRQRVTGEIEHIEYTVHGLRKNGTTIIMDIRSVRGMHNGRWAVFGTVLDMTARKQMEDALEAAALLDPLTGFYNRRGFLTVTTRQLLVARRKKQSLILIAADVDDLKTINDTFGHAAGDEALVAAATVLRDSYREADVVARLGGDEFVVFPLDASVNSVPLLLERLEINLQAWREQHPRPYVLSISTGSSVLDASDESVTIEELLAQADSDLYRSKRARLGSKPSRMAPFWGSAEE